MEDNCFTIMCWSLPDINMNQSWVCICPLPPATPSPLLPLFVVEHLIWAPCIIHHISTGYLILHMVMYTFPRYPLSSSHPLLPQLCPQFCSLCLHLYYCPANSSSYHVSRFHIYALYEICFSLSDLLHSV